ncbi:MAG: hypothetical protein COA69_01400 [Robiginitomaculum sp.]|nr:MAG: hypothetical protein COA69_01400 [Robiginitomaculum sp.]
MRVSLGLLILTSTLVVTSCSTSQINPIYQQTTKYKASTPAAVQQARYETQSPATITYATNPQQRYQAQNPSYTRVNPDCLSNGINYCEPEMVPVNMSGATLQNPAVVIPAYEASATTDLVGPIPQLEENTASFGEQGTPGYYAVRGLTPPQETRIAVREPVSPRVFPQTRLAEISAEIERVSLNTQRHIVISGDTVYSLARKSCISIAELKTANGINDEFYIRVGDEIMIPLSNCVD